MATQNLTPTPAPQFPQAQPIQLCNCTVVDYEGYECGDPAVVALLDDSEGEQALCARHFRKVQLSMALEALEASRG